MANDNRIERTRYTEYMAVSELMTRLHPQNPKEHDIPMIAQSFLVHGFVSSGTLDERTGLFLCGHGRTEALQYMIDQQMDVPRDIDVLDGKWYCPVERGYNSLNDAQAIAYIAIDNQATIAGDWNKEKLAAMLTQIQNSDEIDLSASGFNEGQLKEIMTELANQNETQEEGDVPIDRAEELNEKWQVELGDIWEIPSLSGDGTHRIMCGDSTCADDVEMLMGGVKADLVLTDPPYNLASNNHLVAAGSYSKSMATLKQSEWDNEFDISLALVNLLDVIGVNASVYIFSSHHLIASIWEWMSGWADHHNWCVWNKVDATPSLTQKHWTWNAELVAYATRGEHSFNHTKNQHALSVWTFHRVNSFGYLKDNGERNAQNDAQVHPTQKPIDLIRHPILHSSNAGALVYDPFLGSGTTIVAAEQTGRIGYGMELHPPYVAITIERLSALGLSPVRV